MQVVHVVPDATDDLGVPVVPGVHVVPDSHDMPGVPRVVLGEVQTYTNWDN